MDLSPLDYEILNFISKHESVDKQTILNKFPSSQNATEYRIKLLSTPELSEYGFAIENTNYICQLFKDSDETNELGFTVRIPLGIFCITDKGRKSLQDKPSFFQRNEHVFLNQALGFVLGVISTLLVQWLNQVLFH